MRVLVVGAGIGGLTLAALLLRVDGVEVEIVERAPALRPDGFGLLLYPFGSRVLRELGCWEALLADGCTLSTMSLPDGRGAVVEDYDLAALRERVGPLVCVRRPVLMGLLEAAVGHWRASVARRWTACASRWPTAPSCSRGR
jgi:2-polyprenyl-6-methoxyphenol hydroxylase-like FAD-dependent oxidoreductase